MPKHKKKWLIFPTMHSTNHSEAIESAIIEKSHELLGEGKSFKFFFLTGNYLGSRAFAYSAVRYWPGAMKPESIRSSRRPVLDATFACLSVYLTGLVSYQTEYLYAYDEIKDILEKNDRPDLVEIIEEKLPFVSLPPKQMLKEGQSPISPYYLIRSDEDLLLAELYPSVQLTEIIDKIRSRYITFFNYQGYNCFGYFDNLPENARFGFNTKPKEYNDIPDEESIINFITKEVETLKDLFVIFITAYNNAFLTQYLLDDYESLLNKVLEFNMETEMK
ncbi:MAG: hypothetical protein ACTSRA_21595 [Promethearchaeota archaeon]